MQVRNISLWELFCGNKSLQDWIFDILRIMEWRILGIIHKWRQYNHKKAINLLNTSKTIPSLIRLSRYYYFIRKQHPINKFLKLISNRFYRIFHQPKTTLIINHQRCSIIEWINPQNHYIYHPESTSVSSFYFCIFLLWIIFHPLSADVEEKKNQNKHMQYVDCLQLLFTVTHFLLRKLK